MGGGALKKKIHLVKWSTICKAKSKRGLGVRSLSLLDKALLLQMLLVVSLVKEIHCGRKSSRESLRKKGVGG